MTRYADPLRCPDCRAPISSGEPACPRCGLSLRGETAQRLYGTLVLADELIAVLRAASVPAGAPLGRGAQGAPGRPLSPTTSGTLRPVRRRGLRLTSVPQILLALGAGCLLVAALVFLVVNWSVLGVGGRTATLVVLTVVAVGCAALMARRGLRAAAESLALVGFGLLTLDVLGADNAGWFGDLSTPGLEVTLGSVLVITGVLGAVAARRTAVATLTCAEVVAAIGTALGALGVASADTLPDAPSLVLATLLAAVLTGLLHRGRLAVATNGAAGVTVLTWVSLAGYALDRALDHDSWHELWIGGEAWPLVVAAALVASLLLLPRLPVPGRVSAVAIAQLLLVCALLTPTARLDMTTVTLVAIGVLAVAGAAACLLPRPWGAVNLATQAVAAAGVLVVGGTLAVRAAARLAHAAGPPWSGSAGDRLPLLADSRAAGLDSTWLTEPAGWLLPVCLLALLGTGWAVARAVPALGELLAGVADVRLGAALLAASVVAAVALYPVPLWLVLGLLLLVASGFTTWWLVPGRIGAAASAPAAMFLGAAVLVSLHADGLSAVALSAAAAFFATVLLRDRSEWLPTVAGASLSAALAGAVWSWGSVAGIGPQWVALVALLVLGGPVLLAPYGSGWLASTARKLPRIGIEAGAALSALVLVGTGITQSPVGQQATWAAVYLTVCGAVVTALSLLQPDRRALVRVGGALLAMATWVRLWDLGVRAPEAYTLPTAVVLVLLGLHRMRRDRSATTLAALGPGLSLMLVPSALWVLMDPTSTRALLLGIGCLVLVLSGARLGWTAPLAIGAAVGAVVVLRMAAPYVGDAVPRWVLLGAAGALLITVGATWERRLADAQSMMGYLRTLR